MKRVILFLLLSTLLQSMLFAKIAIAQSIVKTSSDGTTLTFLTVYSQSEASAGVVIQDSYSSAPSWCSTKVKKVVFDSSFSNGTFSSTAYWLCGCSNLTTIEGLEYLNTNKLTTADCMFDGCSSLTTIDLSHFNPQNLKSCRNMFQNCSKLKTIYGTKWDITSNMTNEEKTKFLIYQAHHSAPYMFNGCNSLVGGNGTKYDATLVNDYTYCHVDGGTTDPGYFTDINNEGDGVREAYSVLENNTLTFYYDWKKGSRQGTTYPIEKDYTSPFSFIIVNGVKDDNSLPGWYYDREYIKRVSFDYSFKYYLPKSTRNWYYSCSNIESIDRIENLSTDNVTMMDCMFMDCSSLKNLDLSSLNTEKVVSMANLFGRCTALERVDVSNFNTSNVIYMGCMFGGCEKLQNLNVSNFNTSKVEDMYGMFCDCNSITELDVTKFNTSNVTNMALMFCGCNLIKELDLCNFNTANVTRMDAMFMDCSSLNNLDLKPFITSNVTNMSAMFTRCKSLTNLDLSNFDTRKVTDMSYMFMKCSSLEAIDISSFITTNVKNMSEFFAECSKLTSLSLCNFDTSNVIEAEKIFYRCTSLSTIKVSSLWNMGNVTNGKDMFSSCISLTGGNFTQFNYGYVDSDYAHIDYGTIDPGYLTDCNGGIPQPYVVLNDNILTFYYDNLKDKREGEVFTIGPSYDGLPKWAEKWWLHAIVDKSFANYHPTSTAWWFAHGSPGKQTITITGLDNLATDQVVNMESMFYGCAGLESLDVSHFNTSKVTNMKQMFCECGRLESLDVTNFDTSKVQLMCGMFSGCRSLSTLDVTNFDTSNVEDMGAIFAHCDNLTSLDVTKFNTSKVRNMSNIFSYCSSLKSIDVTNFDTSNATSMYLMFDGCSSLTELDLRNFNTSKVETMPCMFMDCSQLEYLDLSSFDIGNVRNMEGMFKNCNNLKTIYVGDKWNTYSMPYSEDMFWDCEKLVGGMGTKYDSSHIDCTYARIDGGSSAPGYFTYKKGPVKKGDINGDGVVGQDDIDLIVEYILTGVKPKGFVFENADVNGDNKVDAADIVEIVNMINK